jgi:hypothetical protein
MTRPTRLEHAVEALIAEIKEGFEPAPERISRDVPQRLLTDWVWSPNLMNIAGRSPWLHFTGEVLAVDPGQAWALCVDAFYWLRKQDDRVAFRTLFDQPRPDVDVGSTADLSDDVMELMGAAMTPAEHDYDYDEDRS